MNSFLLCMGLLCGWATILALPWLVVGNVNPFQSALGLMIVLPFVLPLWLVGESASAGAIAIPKFTFKRLEWSSRVYSRAPLKLFAIGLLNGIVFAFISGSVITIALAFTTDSLNLLILAPAALFHLALFCFSFIMAYTISIDWTKRVFREHRTSP